MGKKERRFMLDQIGRDYHRYPTTALKTALVRSESELFRHRVAEGLKALQRACQEAKYVDDKECLGDGH